MVMGVGGPAIRKENSMTKFKKMKSISKTVFALCIAMSIFVGNSVIASAKCPGDKEGLHHFTVHRRTGDENNNYQTHMHLIGYDSKGDEVYVPCTLTFHSEYCVRICMDCGAEEPGSLHLEQGPVRHSVN